MIKSTIVLCLLLAIGTTADARMVFYGVPSIRVTSTMEDDEREDMTGSAADDNFIQVDERDGQYYWTSRDDRPLELTRSGVYWCFVNVASGSYLKVEVFDGKMRYMEHVHRFLGTITYFGEEGTFDP